jgi:MoaA/NifB/PqqE/SkfB family radical SAM enzyme
MNRSKLLLKKPNPKDIVYINFAVTYLCNSHCSTCNIWDIYKKNPKKLKEELNFDEISEIFNKSKLLSKIQTINLSGGEPALKKDFVDLCGFFIEKYPNLNLGIATNAVAPSILLNKLKEFVDIYNPNMKKVQISISFDGIGETHDTVRGVRGNFKNTLKFIKSVKADFPEMKQGISFTITPTNYKDILRSYKLSKKMNMSFGIQFAQTSDFYVNNEKNFVWDNKKLDDVKIMIDQICSDLKSKQNLLQRLDDVNGYFLKEMVEFQRNGRISNNCYSGTHSFFMNPYGDIYPCIMLNKKMGNAFRTNFDELWLSNQSRIIREYINEKNCRCWTPCEAHFSLFRDLNLILKL